MTAPPMLLNEPVLRWSARARSIPDIEKELARIWARQDLTTEIEGQPARHIAARTSVMNLVVIARRPEIAERGAATIQALTGRHPSRTIVVQSADPDGPSWIDARIEAHCVVPREDAPEICAETIHLIAGGEAGRHLSALVAPLIVHDLPVTVWWPGEPPFTSRASIDLLTVADRLVVDGSTWNGDGLGRLAEMDSIAETARLAVSDFAMVRQSRWREAIASIFDDPDYLPYLRSIRRIAVAYATHDDTGAPGSTNLVKPVYHVAWLASRLGLNVVKPLAGGRRTGSRSGEAESRWRCAACAQQGDGGDPVGRTPRGGGCHPAGGLADAVRNDPARRAPGRSARFRAARRCHRRGRNGARPGMAGRGRVPRAPFPGCAARRRRPPR